MYQPTRNVICKWQHLKRLPEIVDKITSFVLEGKDGVRDLKTLVKTTRWFRKSALSDHVISKLNVVKHRDYAFWVQNDSPYNSLFRRLLRARHLEAIYIESIHLAFHLSEIDAAIILLETIKERHRLAKMLFLVLNRFIRRFRLYLDEEKEFLGLFYLDGMDIWRLGGVLQAHVGGVCPKDANTFGHTFRDEIPECYFDHPRSDWRWGWDGDRCPDCVFYYLARDLVKMS